MLLEVENLHIAYGDIKAVSGVSFDLEEGELVSIIGANGAGKTSILNAVMGIVETRQGRICFRERDISSRPAFRRARDGIRLVPERARIFPRLTVHENLLVGAYGLRNKIDLDQRFKWLYTMFPILAKRLDQPANTMSGGEQQQLAIARALVSGPSLLLVDEVSMGLMPKLADEVFELLYRLNREQGLTILLVEQNAVASLEISKRAYVLETGRLVHRGDATELSRDERIRQAYLGQ